MNDYGSLQMSVQLSINDSTFNNNMTALVDYIKENFKRERNLENVYLNSIYINFNKEDDDTNLVQNNKNYNNNNNNTSFRNQQKQQQYQQQEKESLKNLTPGINSNDDNNINNQKKLPTLPKIILLQIFEYYIQSHLMKIDSSTLNPLSSLKVVYSRILKISLLGKFFNRNVKGILLPPMAIPTVMERKLDNWIDWRIENKAFYSFFYYSFKLNLLRLILQGFKFHSFIFYYLKSPPTIVNSHSISLYAYSVVECYGKEFETLINFDKIFNMILLRIKIMILQKRLTCSFTFRKYKNSWNYTPLQFHPLESIIICNHQIQGFHDKMYSLSKLKLIYKIIGLQPIMNIVSSCPNLSTFILKSKMLTPVANSSSIDNLVEALESLKNLKVCGIVSPNVNVEYETLLHFFCSQPNLHTFEYGFTLKGSKPIASRLMNSGLRNLKIKKIRSSLDMQIISQMAFKLDFLDIKFQNIAMINSLSVVNSTFGQINHNNNSNNQVKVSLTIGNTSNQFGYHHPILNHQITHNYHLEKLVLHLYTINAPNIFTKLLESNHPTIKTFEFSSKYSIPKSLFEALASNQTIENVLCIDSTLHPKESFDSLILVLKTNSTLKNISFKNITLIYNEQCCSILDKYLSLSNLVSLEIHHYFQNIIIKNDINPIYSLVNHFQYLK
ncbi:hypothetical protein CYY_004899 [Polysphondylium violaceum]|uniref:Uncharacterized protein n=1 Tax=Polysphondylium violaceum TaxID=133409 RepID=A0A8J4PV57_9MYCE|nr:hypothetical protein CYY_004899 [Polysphondylium violaceum]